MARIGPATYPNTGYLRLGWPGRLRRMACLVRSHELERRDDEGLWQPVSLVEVQQQLWRVLHCRRCGDVWELL